MLVLALALLLSAPMLRVDGVAVCEYERGQFVAGDLLVICRDEIFMDGFE